MRNKHVNFQIIAALTAILLAGFFMAACTQPAGGGTAGKTVVMSGAMNKGSCIVNGVQFAVNSGTAITVNGVSGKTEADLLGGMVVKLRGTENDDGVTGTATIIEASNELQGQVQVVNAAAIPPSFTVLNQMIFVSSATVFVGGIALDATGQLTGLAAGDWVEVHGMRDLSGNVRATLVKKLAAAVELEIKGPITNLVGLTFTIGTLPVDATAATIVPSTATLANGMHVEITGTMPAATFIASRVQIEELTENPELHMGDGMEAEVQGYVMSLATTATGFQFTVDGLGVTTDATTLFKNGSSLNLANNILVEVRGTMSGSSLMAKVVEFHNVRIEFKGTASASTATSVTLLGVTVKISSLTQVLDAVVIGSRYKVEACMDGADLVADVISLATGTNDGIEGPVTAMVGTPTWTMTVAGINIDLSTATVFKSAKEAVIDRPTFFASVTAAASGGTGIHAEGVFAAGTLTAVEAGIED